MQPLWLLRLLVALCALPLSSPLGAASWEWDALAPGGAAPSARAGASLTRLPSVGAGSSAKLVLCGGQGADRREVSGCALLDPLAAWSFSPVLAEGQTAYRSDHSAVVVPAAAGGGGAFLLLYGGVNATPVAPVARRARAGLASFDARGCEVIDVGTWQPAPPASDCDLAHAPIARYAHSSALMGSAWLVFGGVASATGAVLDDGVQALDVSRAPVLAWAPAFLPATGARPQARAFHAAASFGLQMLVFGGQGDSQGTQLLSDVWSLGPVASVADLPKAAWAQRVPAAAGAGGSARTLRGHRLELVGSLLLAYGGEGAPPGGLMTLDLASASADWAVPSVAGAGPGTPFRAAVALLDEDGDADPELVVFGGAAVAGPGAVSASLAVLRQLGADNSLASSANLPYILGGGASGLLLLGALALVGYLRSRRGDAGGIDSVGAAGGGGGGVLFEQGRRAGAEASTSLLDYASAYQATAAEGAAGAGGAKGAASALPLLPPSSSSQPPSAATAAASEARRYRSRGRGGGGGGGAVGGGAEAVGREEEDETSFRF